MPMLNEIEQSQEILKAILERSPGALDASMILAKQYMDSKNYKAALQPSYSEPQ
jgi:cytochrome c-type biogenesis protein CcmH/NrfG